VRALAGIRITAAVLAVQRALGTEHVSGRWAVFGAFAIVFPTVAVLAVQTGFEATRPFDLGASLGALALLLRAFAVLAVLLEAHYARRVGRHWATLAASAFRIAPGAVRAVAIAL
jgi:hypothetical protein